MHCIRPVFVVLALFVGTFAAAQSLALLSMVESGGNSVTLVAPADSARWAFSKSLDSQENRDSLLEWLGPKGELLVPVASAGVTLIGVDYLPIEDSVSFPLGNPFQQVRGVSKSVRHIRSAAMLFRNPAAGEHLDEQPSPISMAKSGLSTEIRCLMDPTALVAGRQLPIRVYCQAEPFSGGVLWVRYGGSGLTEHLVLDKAGVAHPVLKESGQVSLAVMSLNKTQTELHSASLSFEVPAEVKR